MANLIINSFDKIYNWARANSLWPITFASSCCSTEIIGTTCSDFDISRFGSDVCSPRQADLLIVAGSVTHKSAPPLLRLYLQMAEPKYVIAMGACACTGGMFKNDSYSVVFGADKIIPVDIYVPFCPPKPESLLHALMKLQQKIKSETFAQRHIYLQQHHPKLFCNSYLDILTKENFN